MDMDDYSRRDITKLKEEISSPRVLALYDTEAKTKVSADASAHGIGPS